MTKLQWCIFSWRSNWRIQMHDIFQEGLSFFRQTAILSSLTQTCNGCRRFLQQCTASGSPCLAMGNECKGPSLFQELLQLSCHIWFFVSWKVTYFKRLYGKRSMKNKCQITFRFSCESHHWHIYGHKLDQTVPWKVKHPFFSPRISLCWKAS